MSRREYEIDAIIVNERLISSVIIDSHYKEKHQAYMSDELILKLVNKLHRRDELPEVNKDGFQYFSTLIELNQKKYKLIWLLEESSIYIGVINAYRDDREK